MTDLSPEPVWSADIDLLVSDMDGTIVTPDKTLTPEAIAAVARLGEAGIGFTLISARPPRGMQRVAKALGVSLPIAAFNGGNLIDAHDHLLSARRLAPDLARQALTLLAQRGVDAWVFADGGWRLRDPNAPKVDRERRAVAFEPTVVENFDDVIDRIDKLVGVSEDHDLLQNVELEAQALWGDQATILRSQPYYLDFTHSQANKGGGVTALCAEVGVDLARTAVIGDMFNDVSMFQVAGFAIAMGQAPQGVKDEADVITGPNTENGFAQAIDRLLAARAAAHAG